jgi:hypothetical protein
MSHDRLAYLGDLTVTTARSITFDLTLLYASDDLLAYQDWRGFTQRTGNVGAMILAVLDGKPPQKPLSVEEAAKLLPQPPPCRQWTVKLVILEPRDEKGGSEKLLLLPDGRFIIWEPEGEVGTRLRAETERAPALTALVEAALAASAKRQFPNQHPMTMNDIDVRWFELDAPEPTQDDDPRLFLVAERRRKAKIGVPQTCDCGETIWSHTDLGAVAAALYGQIATSLPICGQCARAPRKAIMRQARKTLTQSVQYGLLLQEAETAEGDDDVTLVGRVGTVARMRSMNETEIEFAYIDLAVDQETYLAVAFAAEPKTALMRFNGGDKVRVSGRFAPRAISYRPSFRGLVRVTSAALVERGGETDRW